MKKKIKEIFRPPKKTKNEKKRNLNTILFPDDVAEHMILSFGYHSLNRQKLFINALTNMTSSMAGEYWIENYISIDEPTIAIWRYFIP